MEVEDLEGMVVVDRVGERVVDYLTKNLNLGVLEVLMEGMEVVQVV